MCLFTVKVLAPQNRFPTSPFKSPRWSICHVWSPLVPDIPADTRHNLLQSCSRGCVKVNRDSLPHTLKLCSVCSEPGQHWFRALLWDTGERAERGKTKGKTVSPRTALGEPPAFVIPFDQISVKDECHALFQPAVRGLPCDSKGVDICLCTKNHLRCACES